MTEPTPIVVNASAAPAIAGTLARDVLVIAAALPILIKLIGAHDLTAILQWLQSSDGATFLAIALPILASGWRALLSLRAKQTTAQIADHVDDSIAVVVGGKSA